MLVGVLKPIIDMVVALEEDVVRPVSVEALVELVDRLLRVYGLEVANQGCEGVVEAVEVPVPFQEHSLHVLELVDVVRRQIHLL